MGYMVEITENKFDELLTTARKWFEQVVRL